MLEYKLKLYGIQLIKQEESYTSHAARFHRKFKRYGQSSNRKEDVYKDRVFLFPYPGSQKRNVQTL